jgi:hypothetical protein
MLLALALALTAMRGSDLPVAVCVVAPRVEALSQGDARGEVPLGAPRLVVIEPLLEVRIERPGQPPWQRLAGQGQVIQGPLDWPVAPIAPNETVLIRLRPQLAPEGTYAHVELKGWECSPGLGPAFSSLNPGRSGAGSPAGRGDPPGLRRLSSSTSSTGLPLHERCHR